MENASAPTPTSPPWEIKSARPIRGRMVRKFLLWSFVIALIAVIGFSMLPKPIEVEVHIVKRGPLTVNVVEEGRTRIRNRYIISAPVAGQMQRIAVKAGDPVKAGETILTRIEPSALPLLDARSKAQAEAGVQAADAARLRAQEAVQMAKTAEQFAASNWTRVKNLSEKGTVSETDRDNAQREAEMKQREAQAAAFALQVAGHELEQARAALLQLDTPGGAEVLVRSPVDGVVLRVEQESSMVVTPGTPLLEVGDPSDLEIEAEVLSRDAVVMAQGTPAVIDQWGGQPPLEAIVRRVEPAAFTKVSALGVEEQRVLVLCDLIKPPAAARALGDRFRVEVRIAVWHEPDALLIPAGALFREGMEWKTFIQDGETARSITVQIGRTDGRMTQVLDGIEAGAKVLLHPPDTVLDGVSVKERAT
jgi:HlyD family secretion protein